MTLCRVCGAECPTYHVLILGGGVVDFCGTTCCDKYMKESGIAVVFEAPPVLHDDLSAVDWMVD